MSYEAAQPNLHGRDHGPDSPDPTFTGRWHRAGDAGEPTLNAGISNVGGTTVPFRWRLDIGAPNEPANAEFATSFQLQPKKKLRVEGEITGAADGDVITTLPQEFWPDYDTPVPWHNSDGTSATYLVKQNGQVVYRTAVSPLNPDYGIYGVHATIVPSDDTADGSWYYISGSAMLDLTADTHPGLLERGVYAITGTLDGQTGWTAGVWPVANFHLPGLPATDFWVQSPQMTGGFSSGVSQPASWSMTAQCDIGQPVVLSFWNFDTGSRTIGATQIRIQRLFTY